MTEEGRDSKRVGFKLEGNGVPRSGMAVFDESGRRVGQVTSGTSSPISGAIGMAYVHKDLSKAGSTVFVDVRNTKVRATVAKLPFVPNTFYRAAAAN